MRYGTAQAADAIGCSKGQLQRWDENRLLVAHRAPRNKRLYTAEELRIGRIITRLSHCKESTANIRKSLRGATIDHTSRYVLYQAGHQLKVMNAAEIIDYLKHAETGVIVIDLHSAMF